MAIWLRRWLCDPEVRWKINDAICALLGHRTEHHAGFAVCMRCGWYEELPREAV